VWVRFPSQVQFKRLKKPSLTGRLFCLCPGQCFSLIFVNCRQLTVLLLIPAICFLSFLGSLLLLKFADKVNPANRYLAFHFFLNALFGLNSWAILVSDSDVLRTIFWVHYFPVYLLNAPFLYFYVRAVLTDKIHIRGFDYLFFLPFFITLINIVPYSISPWQEKLYFTHQVHQHFDYIHEIKFPIMPFTFYFLFRAVVSLVFVVLAGLIVRSSIREKVFLKSQMLIKWLTICLITVATLNISMIFLTIKSLLSHNFVLVPDEQQNGIVFVTILMSGLIISIFFFPKILYGLNSFGVTVSLGNVLELNDTITRTSKSSDISHERLIQIERLVESYLPRKRYLSPGFSLADLVQDLDIPLHVLSVYFNSFKGLTFVAWKNQLRIAEAIELMRTGKADSYTLESVGEACGYKSRSNFIQAFKAQTGESPSNFLKKFS
jgi:AraC-like DNA-binding protein